jgi:hypothetical protein
VAGRQPADGRRDGRGAGCLVRPRPGLGKPVDPPHVRRGLAGARLAPRARWPQCRPGRDARLPRGAHEGRHPAHDEPAGPGHRRAVDPRLRHRRPDPRLRHAGPAGRAVRLPGHERARRRQRPGVAQHAGGARRRPVRDQRAEGLDVGRQLRRLLLPVLPDRPRGAQAQGHQRRAGRHVDARRHGPAPRRDREARAPRSQRGVPQRRRGCRRRTSSAR